MIQEVEKLELSLELLAESQLFSLDSSSFSSARISIKDINATCLWMLQVCDNNQSSMFMFT